MTPEAEAHVPKAFYKILGDRDEAVVEAALFNFPKYRAVLRGIKVFREVEHEDVAVLSVVLGEKARYPPDGEIVAFPPEARPVVIDERPGEHRYKGVIA